VRIAANGRIRTVPAPRVDRALLLETGDFENPAAGRARIELPAPR
jgi:hypothetical protein